MGDSIKDRNQIVSSLCTTYDGLRMNSGRVNNRLQDLLGLGTWILFITTVPLFLALGSLESLMQRL